MIELKLTLKNVIESIVFSFIYNRVQPTTYCAVLKIAVKVVKN